MIQYKTSLENRSIPTQAGSENHGHTVSLGYLWCPANSSGAERSDFQSGPLLQRVQLLVGQQQCAPDRCLRGVDHLALLHHRLPLGQLLGSLPLLAAELGDQRDHAGVDAGHQPIGLALVVAAQHPAGAAGRIGHVRASLVEDQVQAGAQPIPAFLEGRDARAGTGDFERDGGGGRGLLELPNTRANDSI
jgi:hypothetical protein